MGYEPMTTVSELVDAYHKAQSTVLAEYSSNFLADSREMCLAAQQTAQNLGAEWPGCDCPDLFDYEVEDGDATPWWPTT